VRAEKRRGVGFEKGGGAIALVTERVEMVRCVVAIVKAIVVALRKTVC
jgi:hypothetical protein